MWLVIVLAIALLGLIVECGIIVYRERNLFKER